MEQATETIHESISALTQMRQIISPYLPPPIISLIQTIDHHPQINAYIPQEPSMVISLSLLAIFVATIFMKIVFFREKKIQGLEGDEPEDNVLANIHQQQQQQQQANYTDSVIIFGPCGAGKSLLFHKLKNKSHDHISTVMSLQANVSVENGLRIVDYPGHITLSNQLPSLFLNNKNTSTRAILVVDSTKSLAEAGSMLYQLLTNKDVVQGWNDADEGLKIVVCCNKSDISSAKNWRRVKIQLRSELDKLKKIYAGASTDAMDGEDGAGAHKERVFELTGKGVDLEDLGKNGITGIKLSFMSLSAKNGDGMGELDTFVNEGQVLADNSSVLKSRR